MSEEEALTVDDQLSVVYEWSAYMQGCADAETLSLEEIAEVQAVYDLVKDAIY